MNNSEYIREVEESLSGSINIAVESVEKGIELSVFMVHITRKQDGTFEASFSLEAIKEEENATP